MKKTQYRLYYEGGVSWLQYQATFSKKLFGFIKDEWQEWVNVPAVFYHNIPGANVLQLELYINTMRHNVFEFQKQWPNIEEYLKQLDDCRTENKQVWKKIKRDRSAAVKVGESVYYMVKPSFKDGGHYVIC
jgi:hypothetical protein